MDKAEIMDIVSRERRVERMVQNISHSSSLSADLQDLSQIVYMALLEYKEEVIVSLWEAEEINFFIARIILTQLHSPRSCYNYYLHRHSKDNVDCDIAEIRQVFNIATDG